ncbi:hypothetical protein TOPH_07068 [Tolypocladium ophioglossoides CBS 100239]|uniref:Uncharacterized protein n=1 Tax=Tolypocladium ophioglossoides (strain CBS 100239) TaxID=1163406 RepID=A0A0L0N368_TOLOC|nr:hypothetical protein TOPH_07068 [Tolypocladium ophioglossoides CBS 100239]
MPPSATPMTLEPAVEVRDAQDAAPLGPRAGMTLIPDEKLDLRTDEEIASWLQTRHPVTSEKNIWAFWHSGYANMPQWVQRNIINWVHRLGPEWNVHVLDHVPGSETNIYLFVDRSFFPTAFNNGTMDGPHAGQHQADLVRLPLLWKYGGIWMDAGTMLFRHVDDICWKLIEDPNSQYEVGGFVVETRPGVDSMLNGFIATRKNNPFIKRWHDIYVALWGEATNSHNFHKHPLLRHIPLPNKPADEMNAPDMKIGLEALTDYLAHFVAFERLRKLVDLSDGFNGPEYYAKHMFLTQSMKEMYHLSVVTAWSGARQFELLSAKRSGEGAVKAKTWQEAEEVINYTMANSSTMKLSHGAGGFELMLADIWDREENSRDDIVPDSFAAYMRYGSVHFDQTRELKPIELEVVTEDVHHVGVLEPVQM